jgi:glycosyltransferase involved in cell wall biosynthesis
VRTAGGGRLTGGGTPARGGTVALAFRPPWGAIRRKAGAPAPNGDFLTPVTTGADGTAGPELATARLPAAAVFGAGSRDGATVIDMTVVDCPEPELGLGAVGPGTVALVDPGSGGIELSIVMPCLNEAETIGTCIEKAWGAVQHLGVTAEIVVADNGSTDGSVEIALSLAARVVQVDVLGYGSAVMGGISAARGRYVIIGDADDSYDFSDLAPFVEKLREGYELVVGNRFHGERRRGAMPFLHRYLGTPVLTAIGHLFFGSPVGDLNCGMRGLRAAAMSKMDLRTTGMEFASEMIVQATLQGLRISETPTTLSPAGRSRRPHLRAWRDGWRHLRLLLLHSPAWLFLYPGMLLMLAGAAFVFDPRPWKPVVGGLVVGAGPLIGGLMIASGYLAVILSCLAEAFAVGQGMLPANDRLYRLSRRLSLELGLLVGFVLVAAGVFAGAGVFLVFGSAAAVGPLESKLLVAAFTVVLLGAETILLSFFLGILRLRLQ